MRKILLSGIVLAFVFSLMLFTTPDMGYAADDYLETTGTKHDSTYLLKHEQPWDFVYIDTFTLTLGMGDTTIDLGWPAYNFRCRSLNAADDSTFVKVALSSHKSFFYDDSVARNYDWHKVGEESADDWFRAPVAFDKIYYRVTKGDSTAGDTSVIILQKFNR